MKSLLFFLFFCVLVFSVFFLLVPGARADGVSPVDVESLINEALEKNPQVQAAHSAWKAAEYKVRQVEALPDPTVSYTYFGENVETRVGPQEHKYGISQKFPFPGKLKLEGKSQSKRAAVLHEQYEAVRREVIKDVLFVYYDIYWVDKAIRITEEEKSILESLDAVAQRKYESNLVPQQDVIKIQVELSKLIDKLLLLRQNRKSLVAKMNSICNRPKSAQIASVNEVVPQDFTYNLDELNTISRRSSQDLLAANLDIERAEYERSLAKMDYLPDFTLGFDYIQVGSGHTSVANDGRDAWMGTIAVTVPVWFDKLSAKVDEKQELLEAGKNKYQDVVNSITYEIDDAYFKILAYKDSISLYKTALIPQTEQAFEAAKIGYESGKVGFLSWLDAERIRLQTRLAYYKTVVNYQKSIAYLEKVVGADVRR